ncbi:MAG: relaxase MobL [Oscillospiraceae bacterium]
MRSTPAVVFSMEFAQTWKIGGYDFYSYLQRPEAFVSKNHTQDAEYKDFMNYMSNSEKSDGIFDMTHDRITYEQVEDYRDLERFSQSQGCPKYIGVMSFDNDFLLEHGILTEHGLNTHRLKELARTGITEMIHESRKLDDDNVYWTAAIHTNTDNVHIHYQLCEYEKRERARDMLEVRAFDKMKSKVVNQIIGSDRVKELTKLQREVLLPQLRESASAGNAREQITELALRLPERNSWQYNHGSMRGCRKAVDSCVNSIIATDPALKEQFDGYMQKVEEQTEYLMGLYGSGNRRMYLKYKSNRIHDFYERAGNTLLREIKENRIRELALQSRLVNLQDDSGGILQQRAYLSERKNDLDDLELPIEDPFDGFPEQKDPAIFESLASAVPEQSDFGPGAHPSEGKIVESGAGKQYCIDWNADYKEARRQLYKQKDYQKAFDLMSLEANSGNVLALLDLGQMYKKELISSDTPEETSFLLFREALEGFQQVYNQPDLKAHCIVTLTTALVKCTVMAWVQKKMMKKPSSTCCWLRGKTMSTPSMLWGGCIFLRKSKKTCRKPNSIFCFPRQRATSTPSSDSECCTTKTAIADLRGNGFGKLRSKETSLHRKC